MTKICKILIINTFPSSNNNTFLYDWLNSLEAHPPATNSRECFTTWLCIIHNKVNEKIGKPIFDCNLTDERWRGSSNDGCSD